MKKTALITIASLAVGCQYADAQENIINNVENLRVERNGKFVTVDMDIRLDNIDAGTNRAILITPRLRHGSDSTDMRSVGIYGRRRYYYYVRNGESMLTGKDEMTYRAAQKPANVAYHTIIPYSDWMDGAQFVMHREDYGCCGTLIDEETGTLPDGLSLDYMPQLVFVRPAAEAVKARSLSGSAYIDFPVNETVIYPEYRRNTVELDKIVATIDSVRNDKDIEITALSINGFASPESPYSNNDRLARGRTEALKRYVMRLYSIDEAVIATSHESEDWAGLRRYVDRSNLEHRPEILSIIDSSSEPDAKEAAIKRAYPDEYRFLLTNCYPALRHSDYRIDYIIRGFSDVEEIKRIIKERPQKLSLQEFYLAAQSCEAGSEEFNDIFETAVRMFPEDETANLNAANTAMQRKDMKGAERYLTKAGASPEATYARGVYAVLTDDYETAARYMGEAQAAGIAEAADVLRRITPKSEIKKQ